MVVVHRPRRRGRQNHTLAIAGRAMLRLETEGTRLFDAPRSRTAGARLGRRCLLHNHRLLRHGNDGLGNHRLGDDGLLHNNRLLDNGRSCRNRRRRRSCGRRRRLNHLLRRLQ